MKFFLLAHLACILCTEVRVDPDTLPSIEVLLVPPKEPYPQVHEEMIRIHEAREKVEMQVEGRIRNEYQSAWKQISESIQKESAPIVERLLKVYNETVRSESPSSFADISPSDSHIKDSENLVIQVKRTSSPDARVRSIISAMSAMRGSIVNKQLEQAASEFKSVGKIIVSAIKKALVKYFKGPGSPGSFLQTAPNAGINQVVNVRVGSSNVGDGLMDGSSYPSVLGLVEDEFSQGDVSEEYLLRMTVKLTNKLVQKSQKQLLSALSPRSVGVKVPQSRPSFVQLTGIPSLGKVASQMPIPPGAIATIRQRALEHSTVELDITPPDMDRSLMVDQLNADLQGFKIIHKSRVSANLLRRKAVVESISRRIERAVKRAADQWRKVLSAPTR